MIGDAISLAMRLPIALRAAWRAAPDAAIVAADRGLLAGARTLRRLVAADVNVQLDARREVRVSRLIHIIRSKTITSKGGQA